MTNNQRMMMNYPNELEEFYAGDVKIAVRYFISKKIYKNGKYVNGK